DDFVDYEGLVATLSAAGNSSQDSPLRRLGQIMVAASNRSEPLSLTNGGAPNGAALPPVTELAQSASQAPVPSSRPGAGNPERPEPATPESHEVVLPILGDVLRHYQLHREPLFAGLKPADPDAEALLRARRCGGRVLEPADQAWLNRHLVETAFRQATGRPCFR